MTKELQQAQDLVLCNVMRVTHEESLAIATNILAAREKGENASVWHQTAIYFGKPCHCAPCSSAPKTGMIRIKCVDATMDSLPRHECLVQDKIYEIDPRRDIEDAPGGARYYFVNGKRYGGYRFIPVIDLVYDHKGSEALAAALGGKAVMSEYFDGSPT